MKLKYYMRGLGIGIILTTLILSISGNKEKLTDKEIISRAEKLGMVMEDSQNSNIDKVLDNISPEPTKSPKSTDAPKPTNTPEATNVPDPTDIPEPTDFPVPTDIPEPSDLPEPTDIPKTTVMPTPIPESNEKTGGKEVSKSSDITFTIESGMSSRKVSKLLSQIGLVDSSEKFNQYVVKVGKQDVIHVGTYIVQQGASYDDIINTITK